MEWAATLLASVPVADLVVDDTKSRPDLSDEVQVAVREARKAKKEDTVPLMLSVTPEALRGEPSGPVGQALYQPIGKIVYATPQTSGSALKKAYLFCYIASEDGSRAGGTNAKYRW